MQAIRATSGAMWAAVRAMSSLQEWLEPRSILIFERSRGLGRKAVIMHSVIPAGRQFGEAVKRGETPADWEQKPAKNRQKDKDARWTKKHNKSFFGYKNHVNADAKHKLIRRYDVSDASVHDSQKLDGLLNKANTSEEVYADSAYRSAEIEAKLKARDFRSRIHRRGSRNHPLSETQQEANRRKSKVRARVEHIFGAQENTPGGRIVRTIGIVRARAKIGLQNLVYNIRRLVVLERVAAA
jgi:IS5 family transposase